MTIEDARAKIAAKDAMLRSGHIGRWARERLMREIQRLREFIKRQSAKETKK
jgi:hypothetical protein